MNVLWVRLAALACVLVVACVFAALTGRAFDHGPAVPEWGDPCDAVPAEAGRPVDWQFNRGGVVVASGRCA